MDLFQNLDLLSVGVAIASTAVLGFTVYFNNRQSITNRTFLWFSLVTAVWGALNYLSYQIQNVNLAFWFLRTEVALAVWHSMLLFQLFYVFPLSEIKFFRGYKFFIFPLTLLVSILGFTPLIFSAVESLNSDGEISTLVNGPAIPLFGITTIGLILSGIIVLSRKTILTKGPDKLKLKLFLTGGVIMISPIIILNFIFPAFLGDSRFVPFGAVSVFPFVIFTSYAILKHKLFNIRVAGTAVLVFLLAVVTFSEVILSRELSLIVYRSSVFLLVLVFGIVLIRGVLREVEQKERLQKLSDELAKANDKLKELDKAKTEFVSIASHQLRAPLTAIKGYASLILEGSFGEFSDKVKKAVDIIFQSSQKLVTVIEDFLNITRIELGRMKYEMSDFDFKKLVEGVVGELRPSIEKRGLTLSFEASGADFTAHGDLGKLNQVVNNLIDNAAKYTPASSADGRQGSIKLTLSKATDSSHKVRLEIKDTGVGIDQETMGRLFQKFTRADDAGKINITGTGLGLYVAKQIIDAHGGRLWAESKGVGKGSTFVVEL